MYKPLVSKMPYPSIENLSQDYKSARIISETFAGIHSEEEYPGTSKYSPNVCDGSSKK